MDIGIRRLTPDLAEDYARFFDATPHSERPDDDECKCYCVWWCSDDQDVDDLGPLATPALRRDYAIRNIASGGIQGYLAYSGGQVVGWCNANTKTDCLNCYCWKRFMGSIPTDDFEAEARGKLAAAARVKSVFCFLISPAFRRKGITKLLLERVCLDAARDGFDVVEAYPKAQFVNDAVDFMGPAELYRKSGFEIYARTGETLVMRKALSTKAP